MPLAEPGSRTFVREIEAGLRAEARDVRFLEIATRGRQQFATSSFETLCGFSLPILVKFSKLIVATNDEQFRGCQDARHERACLASFVFEFGWRVDVRIDFAA